MISKAKSIRGSAEALDYIMNDKERGDALILEMNGITGTTGKEIIKEFRFIQSGNSRCQKNTISIVISPSDERKFTHEELMLIGQEHLKRLGLSDNQYLMTVHESTGHPHIHIIANRIDVQGKALDDSFISKKTQTISENIAKQLNLTTAREVSQIRKQEILPIKNDIKNAHDFARGRAQNFDEYCDYMRSRGVIPMATTNKQGLIQGLKFEHSQSGITFKSSEIGKNYGLKNLIQNSVQMPVNIIETLRQIRATQQKTTEEKERKYRGFRR